LGFIRQSRDWGLGNEEDFVGACGAVYRRRPLAKAQRAQSSQREERGRIFTTEGNSELHGGHGVKKKSGNRQ